MKLKLEDLVNAEPALVRLSQNQLPVKLAYRIQKALRQIDRELQDYHTTRGELVKRHGQEKTVEGQPGPMWEVPRGTEKWDAYIKDLDELTAEEVDLNIHAVQLSMFPEDFRMSPGDMAAMWFLFDDPES